MNSIKLKIKEFFIKESTILILLLVFLAPSNLRSQEISTISEIYNFEIGDIFHYDIIAGSLIDSIISVKNVEIVDFFHSSNNDTVFYVRDIDYKEINYFPSPQMTYLYYSDTVFYTILDSHVNYGLMDSVYTNINLYHGRVINHVSSGWLMDFVNGCGMVLGISQNWIEEIYRTEEMVYYKKGEEEWGTPSLVNVEDLDANTFDVNIYPNPLKDILSIKSNDFENSTVTITSLSGNRIKRIELFSSYTSIDVSDLNSGIYLICVTKKDKYFYRKLIKE
ncbi:MAG: T9SS type A sorting domain-containing protein [Bacteroidota bacterium]